MFGTYEQFKAFQEEQKHEEPESAMARPKQSQDFNQVEDKSDGMPQMSFGPPNVIGNVEDMNNVKATDGQ